MNRLVQSLLLAPAALFASSAMAVNVVQLGPAEGDTDAVYSDACTPDTWCLGTDSFNIYLLDSSSQEPDVDNTDIVYLAFSAVPQSTDDTDLFDISPVDGLGASLGSAIDSGLGTPPINDSNALAGHGIFPTYYEIYALTDANAWTAIQDVPDTVSLVPGNEDGFVQEISMNLSGALPSGGIHIDAFICEEDQIYGNCDVRRFAPFSHDATYVPVPAAVWLFGSGLLGLVGVARRRKNV